MVKLIFTNFILTALKSIIATTWDYCLDIVSLKFFLSTCY